MNSDSLSHRYLLPQVHSHGHGQDGQAGQVRGAVYATVRGSFSGCEYGCAEGVGEAEGLNGHLGFDGRCGGKMQRGERTWLSWKHWEWNNERGQCKIRYDSVVWHYHLYYIASWLAALECMRI